MGLDTKQCKRLGVFFLQSPHWGDDAYCDTLLAGLRPFLDKLVMVFPAGAEAPRTAAQCDEVFSLNGEAPGGAYREALATQDILAYDEIVLFSGGLFGPLLPLEGIFAAMAGRQLDAWSLPLAEELWATDNGLWGLAGADADFTVLRRSFWQNETVQAALADGLPLSDIAQAPVRFGLWGDLPEELPAAAPFVPLWGMYIVERARRGLLPLIKRELLLQDARALTAAGMGEVPSELYAWAARCERYDEDSILAHLLRTANMADIKNCLQLNYVIPSDARTAAPAGPPPRVALFMHLYYADLLESSLAYARSMPESADVYITTDTAEKKQHIENIFSTLACNSLTVEVVNNRGRDVSAFLVALAPHARDYDYVCFTHDKKGTAVLQATEGAAFSYLCFESVLKSRAYVDNLLALFEQNPRLGVLGPPNPVHAHYYSTLGFEWGANFAGCAALAQRLGLTAPMERDKPPIAPLGSELWFRPRALAPLLEHGFTYEDFPDASYYYNKRRAGQEHIGHQIERIYPFVAQSQGFYAAWAMPENIAAMEITMLTGYLQQLGRVLGNLKKPSGVQLNDQLDMLQNQEQRVQEYAEGNAWLKNQLRIFGRELNLHINALAAARKDLRDGLGEKQAEIAALHTELQNRITVNDVFEKPMPYAYRVKLAIRALLPARITRALQRRRAGKG